MDCIEIGKQFVNSDIPFHSPNLLGKLGHVTIPRRSCPYLTKQLPHSGCLRLIPAALDRYPELLEVKVRTRHPTVKVRPASLDEGRITLRTDYSARNLFGGMVRNNAVAAMGLNCNIIQVVDYGS